MNYLAIIPARGGSKGIKDKNIIDVFGKPLIHYSLIPAIELVKKNKIQRAIVSTDSEKIAGIARQTGADVPFLRPAEMAHSKAKSVAFMLHAVEFLEGQEEYYDAVIVLQPTSPLRTSEDIISAIEVFEKSNADSLISVYREEYINDLVQYRDKGDSQLAYPVNPNHNKGVRRQDHKSILIRNGSIYITKVKFLKQEKKVISDLPAFYEMKRSRSINIDGEEDLNLLNGEPGKILMSIAKNGE